MIKIHEDSVQIGRCVEDVFPRSFQYPVWYIRHAQKTPHLLLLSSQHQTNMKMSSWQLTIQVQVLSFLRSNRSNLSFHPVWIHQDHLYQWLRLLSLKLPKGYRFVLIRPAPPRLRSHPAVDNIAATWWPPLRQVMAESRGSREGHTLTYFKILK